jgi:hypothetical protein
MAIFGLVIALGGRLTVGQGFQVSGVTARLLGLLMLAGGAAAHTIGGGGGIFLMVAVAVIVAIVGMTLGDKGKEPLPPEQAPPPGSMRE